MPDDNAAVVRGIYDAFATGDIPAVLGAMSPDITWNEADDFPYADGNPYRGPQAVLEGVFARIGGEWDGFAADIEEILDAGDTVVALGRYKGSYKATGKSQDTQFVHVWKFAGDKAVSFQQYANTLHVARVTGAA
jgi:ketosteroid isomerase-like protein